MRRRRVNKEDVISQYGEVSPKYERMAQLIQQVLYTFIEDAQIDVLDITYRVKGLDSLLDKIERKSYKEPFSEIEDFCGLRIICFYPSDLDRISEIIRREFVVTESVDKAELLEPDRFGYRSLHFIVALKDGWLGAPQYRGLEGLKSEIQVRTILMHAWADISHKLAYKSKQQVPDQFQRRLYQLGALFEIADGQFDILQREKFAYQEGLTSKANETSVFDRSQPLNVDSLQAFLDFYFPSREKDINNTSDLLDDLMKRGINISDLVDAYDKAEHLLAEYEEAEREEGGLYDTPWSQAGAARTILDLTNDSFWETRQDELPETLIPLTIKWRKEIPKKKR